jgi:hypothetical protein
MRLQFDAPIDIYPFTFFYTSCPKPACNKGVQKQNDGKYLCLKCNEEYPNPLFKCRICFKVPGTPLGSITIFEESLFKELFGFDFQAFMQQTRITQGEAGTGIFASLARTASRSTYRLDINFKKTHSQHDGINGILVAIEKLDEVQAPASQFGGERTGVAVNDFTPSNSFNIQNAPQHRHFAPRGGFREDSGYLDSEEERLNDIPDTRRPLHRPPRI